MENNAAMADLAILIAQTTPQGLTVSVSKSLRMALSGQMGSPAVGGVGPVLGVVGAGVSLMSGTGVEVGPADGAVGAAVGKSSIVGTSLPCDGVALGAVGAEGAGVGVSPAVNGPLGAAEGVGAVEGVALGAVGPVGADGVVGAPGAVGAVGVSPPMGGLPPGPDGVLPGLLGVPKGASPGVPRLPGPGRLGEGAPGAVGAESTSPAMDGVMLDTPPAMDDVIEGVAEGTSPGVPKMPGPGSWGVGVSGLGVSPAVGPALLLGVPAGIGPPGLGTCALGVPPAVGPALSPGIGPGSPSMPGPRKSPVGAEPLGPLPLVGVLAVGAVGPGAGQVQEHSIVVPIASAPTSTAAVTAACAMALPMLWLPPVPAAPEVDVGVDELSAAVGVARSASPAAWVVLPMSMVGVESEEPPQTRLAENSTCSSDSTSLLIRCDDRSLQRLSTSAQHLQK